MFADVRRMMALLAIVFAAVLSSGPAGAVPISAFDELGSGNVQANSGWHEFDVVDGVNNTFIIHVQNISAHGAFELQELRP